MDINVELLEKVKAKIREEPRRMDMADWGRVIDPRRIEGDDNLPPCGTVGCIAGWAEILSGGNVTGMVTGFNRIVPPPPFHPIKERIAWSEAESRLCLTVDWPPDLKRRLEDSDPGTSEYAEIVCERIDRFIATDGKE